MADASTWADENSRAIPGSAGWHFVNVPLNAERYSPRDCHNNCVVSRLEEFRRVLADPRAPRDRKRMALRFVIHLVEDAHQPLHVGDNRDRGGNNVQVQFFRDDSTNLHQVWDSGLLREGYRGERELVDDLIEMARSPQARDWPKGTVEDWVNEGLEVARHAYQIPGSRQFVRSGARLGRDYEEANLPLAARRLAQSGVRLSEVLNEALDPPRTSRSPLPISARTGCPGASRRPRRRGLGEPGGPAADDHLPRPTPFRSRLGPAAAAVEIPSTLPASWTPHPTSRARRRRVRACARRRSCRNWGSHTS